jgi:2-phospho-L-lactate transferase/gluconeogenesis factor (CofD/UPF0052 family)
LLAFKACEALVAVRAYEAERAYEELTTLLMVTLSVLPSTWLNVIVAFETDDEVYNEPEIDSKLAILLSSVVKRLENEAE